MEKYRLGSGITLIYDHKPANSVAVEVMFKVGSNNEKPSEAGLSHFLEHMLFEGTKKRKTSKEIANEIEKYGGDFNAYTTGDRTAFFIKIIDKKFDNALDILSDMVKNPVFDKKIIEKEKKVILKEINMVIDDSRLYQWVLFQEALFELHPVRKPTYGNPKAVKSFTRKQVLDYYKMHYAPNNMIISIVGNVKGVKEMVEHYFDGMKHLDVPARSKVQEPMQKALKKVIKKKASTLNSYMVLGYKTVARLHKDSYIFDIITAILGRGQSGWMFDEIRNKHGLAYQVGINNEMELDYGMFAVYTNLDGKNVEKARKLIIEQFRKLDSITEKDLEEAKTYIEGNYTLQMEDNFYHADHLSFWETLGDAKACQNYIKDVNKVSVNDVRRVAKQYLTDAYTITIIEK